MRLPALLSVLAATTALTVPATAADLVDQSHCVRAGCVSATAGSGGAGVSGGAAPDTCEVLAETCGASEDAGSTVAAPSASSPVHATCTWTKTTVTLSVSVSPTATKEPYGWDGTCRVYAGNYLRGSVTLEGWGTNPETKTASIGPGPASRGCITVNVDWSSGPNYAQISPSARCIPGES